MGKHIPLAFLEINSPLIWHWPYFLDAMRIIKKHNFNGLIIHQQSLLSLLAKPSKRCRHQTIEHLLHARNNTLYYLQKIEKFCQKNHIQLWLQGEAIPDDNDIRRKFPEYFVVESEKSEIDFLHTFFSETIPEILSHLSVVRGVRLSLQTPKVNAAEWKQALQSLHCQLRTQGKNLVLRDYRDKEWPRQMLKTALDALPEDVRASLKATELDYRPGFANNLNLTRLAGCRKWLEFDLWGIEYGWTLLPCCLLDELQNRLNWASSVAGPELEAITVRINWEWIPNSPLPESVNDINLFGLAHLNRHPDANPHAIFALWLQEHSVKPLSHQEVDELFSIFTASHEWICKTPNLLGRLLHHHSQLPYDFDQALQLLHMDTRSANWAQAFQPLMPSEDPELGMQQMQLIKLETQQSTFLANHLRSRILQLLPTLPVKDAFKTTLIQTWERAHWYTRAFSCATNAITLRLWMRKYGEQPDLQQQFRQYIQDMHHYAVDLENWFESQGDNTHPYIFKILLDPNRVIHLAESLQQDEP
ncbi:hypothetical protein [Brenneria corticis]|uniref:Uncharacterized protein n=1 Tax=Brenneria corticis TaxID=2173106 RepID=A0A2U1TVI1_9GAMM|nr:hypothetical protein [Brenneria sp. CFCC 11842]PWC13408.1 hypothetical protein DDT56_15255 [Brenneria sp. CFCC 11842]